MKTMTPWILLTALSLTGLASCSDDSDDDDGGGGTSGSTAGKGGSTAGKGGSAGTAGKGGSAGTAGKGGSAGTAGSTGKGGSAGSGGEAGEGTAGMNEGGAAGSDLGSAGDGGTTATGAGGAEGGAAGAMGGAGGEGGAAELTDARILHIVITANTGEINEAQVAVTRASNAAVLSFAEEMVTEHNAAINEANTIASNESITPETNPISEMLTQKSGETVAELNAVDAAEFDVAYMESQVEAHEDVLALIEDQLLPEADNAAVVDFLGDLRAEVEAHLLDAETTLDGL